MNQLEQRYIWNSNNDQSFHEVLSSPSFVAKVCLLSEKQACPKQLAQGIRDIIIEAADIGKIKKLKKHTITNNKPWFDGDCKKIKSHIKLNGNLLKRNPKDYKLREQTFVLKKQLRNLIKRNKYTYKTSVVDKMCTSLSKGQKKVYWKYLNKLGK